MKVLIVNAVPYGSTGRIMFDIADSLKKEGHQVMCTTGFTWKGCKRDDFFITSNIIQKTFHTYMARVTGYVGGFSFVPTWKLIRKIKKNNTEVIHMHNMHGWFVNFPMLFDYIKRKNIRVIWTFHDCWPFTGHCPHYTMISCEKWKKGCSRCQQYKSYPKTFFDFSKKIFKFKKNNFTGIKNLTIVTPSEWLASEVKQSFLKDYNVKVINNGINLSVFKPTESDFRRKYIVEDKYIILGVAYDWDERKGLDVFIELSKKLDVRFQIVLVGTNDEIDKQLPKNIISIHRTQNQQELAEIYTAADVFANPTREDSFPTVNMEALACGTPVVTFNTGGSPEIIDESCGLVTKEKTAESMAEAIKNVCESNLFSAENCVERAKQFSNEKFVEEYMKLYMKD